MLRCRDGKVFVCLLLLILVRPLLQSEEKLVEIKVFVSRSAVHPGEEFKVAHRVRIKKGWHINASKVENELLVPTSLTFDGNQGLQILESYNPQPRRGRFEYSESDLSYYEGEVFFGARLSAGDAVPLGKNEMSGKFRYQACDDRSCRPPKTIRFKVLVEVVPAGQETRATHPEIFARIEFVGKVRQAPGLAEPATLNPGSRGSEKSS